MIIEEEHGGLSPSGKSNMPLAVGEGLITPTAVGLSAMLADNHMRVPWPPSTLTLEALLQ